MAPSDSDLAVREMSYYDKDTVKGIIAKVRLMANTPSETPEAVIANEDTSWAATIAAQLYMAMYKGDVRACNLILDRLDGKQVREITVQTTPIEVKTVKLKDATQQLPGDDVIRLSSDLTPRDYQIPILEAFDNGIRRFCIVQTRRSGKTWLIWRLMIREAIKKKANYLYVFNSEKQLKESIWEAIDNNGVNFIDYVPKELVASIEQGDFRITLKNGSTIRLMLGSNPDNLVGGNPYGIVLDEYATLNPTTIQLLTPILSTNKGWLVVTGTPRGDNHYKKLYDGAVKNDKWYTHSISAAQTGTFTEEELATLRQESIDFYGNEAFFQQEYMVSWISPNSGSVFGELTNIMIDKGHFKRFQYDKDYPVYTAWDIGNADHTVIVFFQIDKLQDIKVIDMIEASRVNGGVEYFVQEVAKKPYPIQQHFLPFDSEYHKGARNETYVGELKKLGVRNYKVLKRVNETADKLNFLRTEFKRLYIDNNLDRLIECLRGMEYEWNAAKQTWSTKPTHKGGYSDVVDALCYMAQASREIDGADKKPYTGNKLGRVRTTPGLYGFGSRRGGGGYTF